MEYDRGRFKEETRDVINHGVEDASEKPESQDEFELKYTDEISNRVNNRVDEIRKWDWKDIKTRVENAGDFGVPVTWVSNEIVYAQQHLHYTLSDIAFKLALEKVAVDNGLRVYYSSIENDISKILLDAHVFDPKKLYGEKFPSDH